MLLEQLEKAQEKTQQLEGSNRVAVQLKDVKQQQLTDVSGSAAQVLTQQLKEAHQLLAAPHQLLAAPHQLLAAPHQLLEAPHQLLEAPHLVLRGLRQAVAPTAPPVAALSTLQRAAGTSVRVSYRIAGWICGSAGVLPWTAPIGGAQWLAATAPTATDWLGRVCTAAAAVLCPWLLSAACGASSVCSALSVQSPGGCVQDHPRGHIARHEQRELLCLQG